MSALHVVSAAAAAGIESPLVPIRQTAETCSTELLMAVMVMVMMIGPNRTVQGAQSSNKS
jgi:hypothetical protein